MMLMANLFELESFDHEGHKVMANFRVQAGNSIFAGHFPGQPVVPGVCLVQLVKEVTEKVVGQKVLLTQAANIKFLQLIIPNESQLFQLNLTFVIESGEVKVNAGINNGTSTSFKFQGIFTLIDPLINPLQ
jgi:3-hydroxyacyl-[acyl-carrier-protein] dehydratase